jgi:hypothetical protein
LFGFSFVVSLYFFSQAPLASALSSNSLHFWQCEWRAPPSAMRPRAALSVRSSICCRHEAILFYECTAHVAVAVNFVVKTT